jgi:RNA polymerase sigma factor (sigma-70 family)
MTDRTTSARLAEEWAHLRHRRFAIHRAASWHLTERPPASLDDILAAVGAGGDRSRSADRRLRRLVAVAADDHLAARIVIQRLVPGLLALSRKYRGSDDAFEELLAHAWIAVRTYNADRSPSNLAASLLSDAEWAAYRRHHRRQANAPRTAQLPTEYTVDEPRHPSDELAELLEDALDAGMPGDDLELIRLLADTTSTEQVATRLAVTSRTVRNRRTRVTGALRELALAG